MNNWTNRLNAIRIDSNRFARHYNRTKLAEANRGGPYVKSELKKYKTASHEE